MTHSDASHEIPDFSLVQGGPLYRVLRAAGLCDERLEPTYRRIIFFAAVTWLPLFELSAIDGRAVGGVDIPYLQDIQNTGA